MWAGKSAPAPATPTTFHQGDLRLGHYKLTIFTTPRTDLFSYTSGRYLYDENLRFEERYVEFDVKALEAIASSVVCKNKTFILTMNDGFEVIVKIPYRHTVPKILTTESEVATLDFLRQKGVPVPRVYAYCSKPDNAVGTEYIIIEKAPGQALDRRWFDLTPKERIRLVTSFVEIERKLFLIPFSSHGSIYYRDSLPQHLRSDLYETSHEDDGSHFCIGPSTDYMFWRGRRTLLDIDRGPWTDHREYARSVGQRELAWTKRYGKPLQNGFPHNTIVEGEIPHEANLDLLNRYSLISPFILPKDRRNPMNKATIRHPDFNPSNIFVSDSCEISCIIDWQHCSIIPLLLAAGNPPLFENPDGKPPKNLEKPSLPDIYDSLNPEEKLMLMTFIDNKPHLAALRHPLMPHRQHAVERAGRQWSGNVITLKGTLVRLNDWFQATILLDHWRSLLDDLGHDGWVRHESFEYVTEMNKKLKEDWIAQAEDEEDLVSVDQFWPFQDHEEFG
ncbi:uncharacterized protein BO97DRAFT_470893 [Aspergillus homomorphus CBS 101889]|uniref:Aminoglycoside phosphotransferase domain-containing protein n=1 Tax=Aspergillus homomorphus (strain CBS 101889) TaxID=1450537 RepID=A0A395HW23_ASPHC|nr:hypothetical protein BO97DRAFT_470893 [Aspergillus homomorphus CBS 101889]RAL11729.1 hypothetical protein BO97DRAFT_470893 [Aspergillus homomorphus CBS 101889]